MSIRTKYMDIYGSTCLVWVGPTPFVITRDPKIAEEIFLSPECLNRSSIFSKPVKSCTGDGLLSLEGNEN